MTKQKRRYRDGEWLHEQYWEKEKPISEIAEVCGVDYSTVHKWMAKCDVPRRSRTQANSLSLGGKGRKYREEGWLREKYLEEELTLKEIAEICDCHHTTILTWLEKFDIPRRGTTGRDNPHWKEYCTLCHHEGRPVWHIGRNNEYDGGQFYPVHRLVAVAEYGFDMVKDKEVHHRNGIPWDNRPENLEIIDPITHLRRRGGSESGGVRLGECALCGERADLDRAVPDDAGDPCHRECWAEYTGAPDWFSDYV